MFTIDTLNNKINSAISKIPVFNTPKSIDPIPTGKSIPITNTNFSATKLPINITDINSTIKNKVATLFPTKTDTVKKEVPQFFTNKVPMKTTFSDLIQLPFAALGKWVIEPTWYFLSTGSEVATGKPLPKLNIPALTKNFSSTGFVQASSAGQKYNDAIKSGVPEKEAYTNTLIDGIMMAVQIALPIKEGIKVGITKASPTSLIKQEVSSVSKESLFDYFSGRKTPEQLNFTPKVKTVITDTMSKMTTVEKAQFLRGFNVTDVKPSFIGKMFGVDDIGAKKIYNDVYGELVRAKAYGELPGQRAVPGQAPKFGLSIEKVENVGYGDIKTPEILPKEISVQTEAKAVGAKRISPDRVAHQQLTPEEGINSLVEKEKTIVSNNSASWIKAADNLKILINKYGPTIPQRSEANIQKYPGLLDDFYKYSGLKKYALNPKNLVDMRDQFIAKADRIKWTPEKEQVYKTKVNKIYIDSVKQDISKGYKYPEAVLNYDKSFKTAVDSRDRYEKGLRTSFSADDSRIVFEDQNKIGAGMKRQDGKPITDQQKTEIKNGVIDFSNELGIDIKKLAENERWVYVHLNNKNPFLMKDAAGLYRPDPINKSISISVGGVESFDKIVDDKKERVRVNTTVAHELGHALDGKIKGKLFSDDIYYSLRRNYKPVEFSGRGNSYWESKSEITARMIEEYIAVKKGQLGLFNREGYWNKDIFETIIKPAVEESIPKHFGDYKLSGPIESISSEGIKKDPIFTKAEEKKIEEIKANNKNIEDFNKAQEIQPTKEPTLLDKKYPKFETGNKLEDVNLVLQHIENKLGVSSAVKSIKDQEALIEFGKEILDQSPMKDFEPYVADAGDYKGTLPEVTGKSIEEIKKNKAFRGVKNQKALRFAEEGDSIVKSITSYGTGEGGMDSEEVRSAFEEYKGKKANIVKEEKKLKKQKDLFKNTDTFQLIGKDASLIGEITATKETPETIKEIIDQVQIEKKARREEVLNHPARPLMKYINKTDSKLPKLGSKTAFGKEGVQILKDLKFDDVKEANKALADYIEKRNEFINPLSRLRLDERNAKFLRDKQQIMEEVEKKIRAEGRNRKAIIEDIRDYFYMTESEMKDVIGAVDYRLISDKKFGVLTEKIREESLKIAEHAVAVSEVEWTIAQKELHRVENIQQVMEFPIDLNKMTTEQLDLLNKTLGTFERGDVFLGVREIETLGKNAGLPDVKTQRQILEEVIGKRTGLPIEKIREITAGSFDDLRSGVSLARQNPFYEILVSDFYQLKIESGMRYREIEQKTAELVKKARASRPSSFTKKLAPTDDMVISYLEEGDLAVKEMIAKDMSNAEIELAHYVKDRYAEMRDFLITREQLTKERQNYYTHRPRSFFEAWLRSGTNMVEKTPGSFKQESMPFIRAFGRAFKETFIDVNKMDEASLQIMNEQTAEILPLEKFFKYSMRRSGQLIPTKNLASAFLGYVKTFELKRGLDQYMPRMEAVARALTPSETTEGGIVKDKSLENFVKKWINTQKGRPITVGPIQPGGVLDGLLRGGVAFTRFLDLALRVPAQVMSLVGEESATFINIGTKKYLTGEYRAKTAQGRMIAKKYESFVGTTFWDKMKEESRGIGSKVGETLYAFYGIAARASNIHHLLGVITKEEFRSGNILSERLTQIKLEMNRWRADDLLHSVMGKTSVGAVFREHKSWAIPILNQTLSNIKTLSKMVGSGNYKKAAFSKEFGELFRGTLLSLILVLSVSNVYEDLKNNKSRTFTEELAYRAMNDAFSFLSALSPTTLFTSPRLLSWMTDLSKAITSLIGAMATGDRTATGEVPGLKQIGAAITPKLIKPLLTPSDEDKIITSISTSTIAAQKELDVIKPEIVEPAQKVWDEVKKLGVGTPEANALVNPLSDGEYEAYKLIKKADNEYWTDISNKVTPIVKEAFKLEFGTPEADALVAPLSDDEYEIYKKVKSNLYGTGEATASPGDWDKQSFITHITNLAKGWSTDPTDAFNKIIKGGDWKITDVRNGQIIVDRIPTDATEKMKAEVGKQNANYKLDHVWAVKAGGGSDKNNLNIISTEEWKINTPVEVYLINQLKEGNITGHQAKEYMVRFKIGRGQVTSGPLFDKYKTLMTFYEIKQEIVSE